MISAPARVLIDDFAAIEIGDGVSIGAFSEIVVQATSPFSPVPGRLVLGDRVSIGAFANVRAAGGTVSLGRNALLAQRVSLIASNHGLEGDAPFRDLPWDPVRCGVEIGEDVWLGAGVVVLPGCRVGAGSVVGASSVVTRDVPAGELWLGTPARCIRKLLPKGAGVDRHRSTTH